MEDYKSKGLQAYKRLPFRPAEHPLTKGTQELYVCDGTTTLLYRYEHRDQGIEIRSIETFPGGYLELMRKNAKKQFYPVQHHELRAVWKEECAMITRQRNKMRAGLNLIH